ncbi:MAG: aminotransferase class V-fold PLP-dependent enzyme, partial [Planctomycetes bacterium]|nr:aminotransferase class V-fold PLP-dependent enzyme [Planctomycetota bacterium]
MDLEHIRKQFPALQREDNNQPVIWCDAPGGTQLPNLVIDAMSDFLRRGTTNLHGAFQASHEADAVVNAARQAAADFIGASNPQEIHFGQNATSLQFALSHAIAHNWPAGSSIIVSQLDHDSNIRPWLRAAADHDIEVREWKINDKAELQFSDLEHLIDDSVAFIAIGAAANSLGTIIDITPISELAHKHHAIVAVDAVHLAPHKI